MRVQRICGRIEQSEIRVARKLSKLEPQGSIAKLSEREANPRQPGEFFNFKGFEISQTLL